MINIDLKTLLKEHSPVPDVCFQLNLYVNRMEVCSLSPWGSALISVLRVFSPIEIIRAAFIRVSVMLV